MTDTAPADYLRDRAIEALRAFGETNRAMTPSRTYLVHDAYQHGETNIKRLAELAGVSRDTIYADLAAYGVEVAADLAARLARWTEDVDQAGAALAPDSDFMGIAANSYQRVWRRDNASGYTEIRLTVWAAGRAAGDCWYEGSWEYTAVDAAGDVTGYDHVAMTKKTNRADTAITAAVDSGLSIEQAVNHAVQAHIQTITLADLHASYRPHWI